MQTHGQERQHRTKQVEDTCAIRKQIVCEKWCEHCRTWVETAGVTGAIAFVVYHEEGDCVKSKPPTKTKTYVTRSATATRVQIVVTTSNAKEVVHEYVRRPVRGGRDQLMRVSQYFAQACGVIEGRTKAAMLRAIERHLGVPVPSTHEWDPTKKKWNAI